MLIHQEHEREFWPHETDQSSVGDKLTQNIMLQCGHTLDILPFWKAQSVAQTKNLKVIKGVTS